MKKQLIIFLLLAVVLSLVAWFLGPLIAFSLLYLYLIIQTIK